MSDRALVNMNKVDICGVKIDNVSFQCVLDKIDIFIKEKSGVYIVTPNVDHIIKLQKDGEFQQVYRDASLVVADGMPLLWAAKFLGTSLKEKISGSDLFPKLCAVAAEKGYKVFLLGGRDGAAQKAADALKRRHSGLKEVGCYCPSFGFENNEAENELIVRMIKQAGPDILFVGLGTPKQEKWIYRFKNKYQVPVTIGVGASFEFVSGVVKRAPLWIQRLGFEWFWRLAMEPKRLWKRYLVEDMFFFRLIMKQKLARLNRK